MELVKVAKVGIVYIPNRVLHASYHLQPPFAASDRIIVAAASVITKSSFFFSGAVSSGSIEGFVNKFCRLFGCDSIIDIEPLVLETVILMCPLSRNRNELVKKLRPFSSEARNSAILDGACSPAPVSDFQALRQS